MWMLLSLFMISSCLFHNGYCFQHSGVNFCVVLKCFKIYFSKWVLTRQCLYFLLAEVFCMKFNRGCPFTNMSIYSPSPNPHLSLAILQARCAANLKISFVSMFYSSFWDRLTSGWLAQTQCSCFLWLILQVIIWKWLMKEQNEIDKLARYVKNEETMMMIYK